MQVKKKLLIVSNIPSENTLTLAKAVLSGASIEEFDNVNAVRKTPLDAKSADVLQADGIIIGTTENFGYMSGLIKDFFERIYYPCLEETQALPYALYIRAGNDGQGANSAVERIVTGLHWKQVQPVLLLKGEFKPEFTDKCTELGMSMAAGLSAGIY